MKKLSKIDQKIDAGIDEKRVPVRNPRFLVFCKEYNVKTVFSHDLGCQKSMKNPSKIDTEIDAEKKRARITEKASKTDAKMRSKSMKNVARFCTGSRADKNRPGRGRLVPEQRRRGARGGRHPPSGCPAGSRHAPSPGPLCSFIPDFLHLSFWIPGPLPEDSNRVHHRCNYGDWLSNMQAKGQGSKS